MHSDNNIPDDANDEDCEQAFDPWSDDGARIFNQMIDEGSAYLAANPDRAEQVGEDSDGDECEYLYPDLCDPDEEGL